jgi:predicted metal-dependent hydrolase
VRIHPKKRCAVLNVPKRASLEKAIAFLRERQGWVEERLARHTAAAIADGMAFSLFGEACVLRHAPGHRGATLADGVLTLGGDAAFLPRRFLDFIRARAKRVFTGKVRRALLAHPHLAARHKPTVTVRDMISRWGSCTRKGRLCFNWRLAFAPEPVADYLVCHELAHLPHPHHGPRFWAEVGRICPHWQEAERWLKRYGAGLYRIG